MVLSFPQYQILNPHDHEDLIEMGRFEYSNFADTNLRMNVRLYQDIQLFNSSRHFTDGLLLDFYRAHPFSGEIKDIKNSLTFINRDDEEIFYDDVVTPIIQRVNPLAALVFENTARNHEIVRTDLPNAFLSHPFMVPKGIWVPCESYLSALQLTSENLSFTDSEEIQDIVHTQMLAALLIQMSNWLSGNVYQVEATFQTISDNGIAYDYPELFSRNYLVGDANLLAPYVSQHLSTDLHAKLNKIGDKAMGPTFKRLNEATPPSIPNYEVNGNVITFPTSATE